MTDRSIRLLGGLTLGQNKSLQLVEIGNSLYLVGIGDNIQLIDKIDHPEQVAQILESFTGTEQTWNTRLPSLTEWIRTRKRPKQTNEADQLNFQEVFQNKLKVISNRKLTVEQLLADQTWENGRANDEKE